MMPPGRNPLATDCAFGFHLGVNEQTAMKFRALSHPALLGLLLAAATLAVFWPVMHCNFLNYDYPDYFTANPHVQTGLSSSNIAWAFTTGHASNWHPLTWLSLMLDAQVVRPGSGRAAFHEPPVSHCEYASCSSCCSGD